MKKKTCLIFLMVFVLISILSAESVNPYRVIAWDEIKATDPVNMAGDAYTNGYVNNGMSDSTLLYNLRNQYRTMTCTVGPTEKANIDRTYSVEFYVDNNLAKTVTFTGMDFPVEVEVDLNYARQLRVFLDYSVSRMNDVVAITDIDFR